jgi:hypothetical protein
MKLLNIFFMLLVGVVANAQTSKVGIDEDNPQTKLEVKGSLGGNLLNVKTNANESRLYVKENGSVGLGAIPNDNAILDISSTTKGFLFPRLDNTQRATITSPAQGLMIYNTNSQCLEVYVNTSWLPLCPN